ncbi:MAG: ECF transporter S component [Bacillota bacterium]
MAEPTFSSLRFWTRTAILLALALTFQMGGFPQPITGPAINAILLIAAAIVSPASGVLIGIFTPVIAFFRGILPPPLGPMIPAIAFGNGMLVLTFYFIVWSQVRKKSKRASMKIFSLTPIIGVIAAALVKFAILAWTVRFIVEVPEPIAQVMSLPQLYTAVAGGFIALLILQALPERLKEDSRILF